MRHNKDIKALHAITMKPYKECRALMKANGWDLYKALGFGYLAKAPEIIKEAVEGLRIATEQAVETLRKFARQLHEALKEQQNKIDSL